MPRRLYNEHDLGLGEVTDGFEVVRDVDALRGGFHTTPAIEADRQRILEDRRMSALAHLAAIITGDQPGAWYRHGHLSTRVLKGKPWYVSEDRWASFQRYVWLLENGTTANFLKLLRGGSTITAPQLADFLEWHSSGLPKQVRARIQAALAQFRGYDEDLLHILRTPDVWYLSQNQERIVQAVEDGTIAALYNDEVIDAGVVLQLINEHFMTIDFASMAEVTATTRMRAPQASTTITGELQRILDEGDRGHELVTAGTGSGPYRSRHAASEDED